MSRSTGRRQRREAQRAAVRTLRAARAALEEDGERAIAIYGRGNCPETGEYHRLNQAVADAEKNVPWWRR